MSIHHFDTAVASGIGILPAVLLQNIDFECEHNKANRTNFYDGRYWMFNSSKSFSKLFEYASKKQVETALLKLRKQELVIVGNYNKRFGDNTLWYAVTDKGKCLLTYGNI